jgi:hypothetical protein
MAKHKLHQVPLVSAHGPTQPPFPGGWVLAVFDAVDKFNPAFATDHQLSISDRSQDRIKAGEPVKQATYERIENQLIKVIASLFPTISAINQFAAKYVNEYFRLWHTAIESGPKRVVVLGFKASQSSVIARALVRDLVLRICYLESCERRLVGKNFSEWELSLLEHGSPAQVYGILISREKSARGNSNENLAEEMKITDKSLYRLKGGETPPKFSLLVELTPAHESHRLLAGIGFIDHLLREVQLSEGALPGEALQSAKSFLPKHRVSLESFAEKVLRKQKDATMSDETLNFEDYIACDDNLLLHPGFNAIVESMPGSLWRAHLHSLQFARVFDLAQAYFQFADQKNDRRLENFLLVAEHESGDQPHHWMNKLRE